MRPVPDPNNHHKAWATASDKARAYIDMYGKYAAAGYVLEAARIRARGFKPSDEVPEPTVGNVTFRPAPSCEWNWVGIQTLIDGNLVAEGSFENFLTLALDGASAALALKENP